MKVPIKLWVLLFFCVATPTVTDILCDDGFLESIWFIIVIPIIPFSYYLNNLYFIYLNLSLIIYQLIYMYFEIFDLRNHFRTDIEVFCITTIMIFIMYLLGTMWAKEIKLGQVKINKLAFYDNLTGLPNRSYLEEKLKNVNLSRQDLSIMIIDFNNYGSLKNLIGEKNADEVLLCFSKLIKEKCPSNVIVARNDLTEFVVLINEITNKQLDKMSGDIINHLTVTPYRVNDFEIFMKSNIGFSSSTTDTKDPYELLKEAGIAVYEAKKRGHNEILSFSHGMYLDYMESSAIKINLSHAIEKGQLEVYYQPQMDLKSSKVIGLEALLRWKHPVLGMVSPEKFIPIAEETGHIVSIGKWVINKVCEQISEWRERGVPLLKVAINVSPVQIHENTLVPYMKKLLEYNQVNPELLEIEITESVVQNIEESITFITEIKKIGVRVSIDDFGTNYSSLSVLPQLPLDFLKIDKSFIKDVSDVENMKKVVKTIVNLGQNLKLKIVAEGIETIEQLMDLKELNCEIGQGYLFSKPLNSKDIESFLSMKL